MTWAAHNVSGAIQDLSNAVLKRACLQPLPPELQLIRTPVGLMFVRGDRAAPGDTLADQVVASFGYWNAETAEYLDLVFFGWVAEQAGASFDSTNSCKTFRDCVREVEQMSKWRYSGETDVLLVDLEIPVAGPRMLGQGRFSFKNSIPLPIEKMVADGRVSSLDAFVRELTNAAKKSYDDHPLQGSVFEISDGIGWTRGRRAVLDQVKHLFLRNWTHVYDELRPFAVCDLSV